MSDVNLTINSKLPIFAVTVNSKLPAFTTTVKLIDNTGRVNVGLTMPGPKGDSGNTVVCKASTPIGGQRVVSLNYDNEAEYPLDFSRAIGITKHAAVKGDNLTIQTSGLMYESSWDWIPERAIYFSMDGVLTQTVPTSGTILQIGFTVSAKEIFIKIGTPINLS